MSTSQNGYPALFPGNKELVVWRLPTEKNVTLQLRYGCSGFLLCHAAVGIDRRVEDIDFNYNGGERDDWSYAFRPVRGYTTTLSNHSSGTAIDLNATDHPLGVNGTFTDKEEDIIHRRLRRYDGCIRWGGDYNGRKDEMHFELDRKIEAVNRVAIELMDTPVGKEILRLNPKQRAVILS